MGVVQSNTYHPRYKTKLGNNEPGILELNKTQKERAKNQLLNIKEENPDFTSSDLLQAHTEKHGDQVTFVQLNEETIDFLLKEGE